MILPSIIQEIFVTLTIGKNQTVDPQPQDELIAWMEDAYKKIEKAIATQQRMETVGNDELNHEELQRSAEWASVIQRCQTM